MLKSAFIVDILRTPIGKYGGMLSGMRPDDMAAHVISSILNSNKSFDVNKLEDVILGAANQAGEDNRNVARMASLLAGLPIETGGLTVNRLCASGLQAIMDASKAIMVNEGSAYLAGGTESMSRAPFVIPKPEIPFSRNAEMVDTTIGWRFTNPRLKDMYYPYAMGQTAENVAEKWNISREAQDSFAHQSQLRYQQAHDAGLFNEEITPVEIKLKKESTTFSKDEHPRLSSVDVLSGLKPAFKDGGTVTAGNSSGINDGAAVSLIVDEDTLKENELTPKVRIVSSAIAGVHPDIMGIGPIPATQKALKRAGLNINDLGLVELNEAFASQSLVCIQELGLDPEIVNVNGGSIAIGHPLGCSGTRISATLIHEMGKRDIKYGLATMCIGVGQGAAVIFEKC